MVDMEMRVTPRGPALMVFALLTLAVASGRAMASGLAFVINSGEASISLLDVTTQQELRRIPMLREPHHMALSPDHHALLIGDTVGNEIVFLDPQTGAVQRRITASDPYQLQFSPDGRFLVVVGLARNQLDIYDSATMRLLHRVPIRALPSHVNFAPDSRTVYVTLQQSGRLAAVTLAEGHVLWNVPVGSTPAGVLWHAGQLLVGIMGAGHVAVLDPADGHLLRQVATGRGAHNLFLSPDHRLIYVTNRVDSTISVLDAHTLAVQRSFAVSGGPDDLDFAPDGMIWATRRFAHSVAIIDPASGRYRTVAVGRSPHGIWLNTHDAWPAQVSQQ
jgi:YVTN family beta-propeller protein